MGGKMIAIAAMMLCGSVFGIVGYQDITVPIGYSLFTPPLKSIKGGAFDIQDIKVYTAEGEEYAVNNRVKLQTIEENGEWGGVVNYRRSKGGWCRNAALIPRGEMLFLEGEGGVLCNMADASVILTVVGEVNLDPTSTTVSPSTHKVIGNLTPLTVDLVDVSPYIWGGGMSSSTNSIFVRTVGINGSYGGPYVWIKEGWVCNMQAINRGDVPIAAGEGLVVCNETSDPIVLKFPAPMP